MELSKMELLHLRYLVGAELQLAHQRVARYTRYTQGSYYGDVFLEKLAMSASQVQHLEILLRKIDDEIAIRFISGIMDND